MFEPSQEARDLLASLEESDGNVMLGINIRNGLLDAHSWLQAIAAFEADVRADQKRITREECAALAEEYPSSDGADIAIVRGIAHAIRTK